MDLQLPVQSVPITTKVVSVQIPLMARCTWYNIMWWSLSVTFGWSVIFYIYTPFSSTNKTDRHDITEILLKVPLNSGTITLTSSFWLVMSMDFIICNLPYLLSLRFKHLLHVFRTWNVLNNFSDYKILSKFLPDDLWCEKTQTCVTFHQDAHPTHCIDTVQWLSWMPLKCLDDSNI